MSLKSHFQPESVILPRTVAATRDRRAGTMLPQLERCSPRSLVGELYQVVVCLCHSFAGGGGAVEITPKSF